MSSNLLSLIGWRKVDGRLFYKQAADKPEMERVVFAATPAADDFDQGEVSR